MNTSSHAAHESELIIPDAVFSSDPRTNPTRRPTTASEDRRLRWADRAMLAIVMVLAVFVASVVAIGAAVVLAVVFVAGLLVRAVSMFVQRMHR